jgi:formyltetrahydrofolate deformylase
VANFAFDLAQFPERFAPIARDFHMDWRLAHCADRPRIAIFVSKYDHCLQDLLYRHQSGELRCEIPLIISNHPDNQRIADFYRIPYFVVPVTQRKQARGGTETIALVREHNAVWSCSRATCRCSRTSSLLTLGSENLINIHHSFLPAFVGSKPYHQAFQRGVKLIGATAHYVTQVLDDGPIIEQDVVRIYHRDTSTTSSRKAAISRKSCSRAPSAGTWKTASCCMEIRPWSFNSVPNVDSHRSPEKRHLRYGGSGKKRE